MSFTKQDKNGAYIDIPEDDRDLVELKRDTDGKYFYRIRGEAIDKLSEYEQKLI